APVPRGDLRGRGPARLLALLAGFAPAEVLDRCDIGVLSAQNPDNATMDGKDTRRLTGPAYSRPARSPLRTRAGQSWLNVESALRETSGKDRKSTRLNSSHVSISYAVF